MSWVWKRLKAAGDDCAALGHPEHYPGCSNAPTPASQALAKAEQRFWGQFRYAPEAARVRASYITLDNGEVHHQDCLVFERGGCTCTATTRPDPVMPERGNPGNRLLR